MSTIGPFGLVIVLALCGFLAWLLWRFMYVTYRSVRAIAKLAEGNPPLKPIDAAALKRACLQTDAGQLAFYRLTCPGCGHGPDSCECHPGGYGVRVVVGKHPALAMPYGRQRSDSNV